MKRRMTLAPLLIALVALIVVLALGAAAMAQPPLHFSLDPAAGPRGGAVTARLFSEDALFFDTATLDLAPLGGQITLLDAIALARALAGL